MQSYAPALCQAQTALAACFPSSLSSSSSRFLGNRDEFREDVHVNASSRRQWGHVLLSNCLHYRTSPQWAPDCVCIASRGNPVWHLLDWMSWHFCGFSSVFLWEGYMIPASLQSENYKTSNFKFATQTPKKEKLWFWNAIHGGCCLRFWLPSWSGLWRRHDNARRNRGEGRVGRLICLGLLIIFL